MGQDDFFWPPVDHFFNRWFQLCSAIFKRKAHVYWRFAIRV